METAFVVKSSCNCLEYLKRIAVAVGLTVEHGRNINILLHNYSKIDFVPQNGIFGAFLNGKSPQFIFKKTHDLDCIYPFGFNISQKSAVELALINPLSIIEGPPGTGKTQTILNIIANAIMREESVAVVSNNNSATKNVLEKLENYEFGFVAAYLGNTSNGHVE